MPNKIDPQLTTHDELLPELASAEELRALPEDQGPRGLAVDLLEKDLKIGRARRVSRTATRITSVLERWSERQAEPRGEVLSGDVGFYLGRNAEPIVGIDVAYISAQTAAANTADARFIQGVPVLAVQILAPSDTCQKIWETVARFQKVGVQLAWLIDTVFHTVTVYSPGKSPELYNASTLLDGGVHLPGFNTPVREMFQI